MEMNLCDYAQKIKWNVKKWSIRVWVLMFLQLELKIRKIFFAWIALVNGKMMNWNDKGVYIANYVLNRVVCTEKILNEFFIDYYPFGKDEKLKEPYIYLYIYISFSKILDSDSINKYHEKYGESIYYVWVLIFIWKNRNDTIEIKFLSRWLYFIWAIVKA